MNNRLRVLFQIIVPLLIFICIFIPREITWLKTVSVLVRYNTTRFIFIASILLFLTLIIKINWISDLTTAILIFSLFALALVGLWSSAYSENYVISGLLPRSDAFYTYSGAVDLLEQGYLNNFTSRRPIFGGLLAFILWLFDGNLQFSLIALTFLSATACYFLAMEIKHFLSPFAAVASFLVQFLFIRRFIGITMSEIIGYILGAVALTFFIIMMRTFDTDRQKAWRYFFLGSLMFALSQAARPGAILTLPLLILLIFFITRMSKQNTWGKVTITFSVIVLGFLLNSFLFKIISKENTVQNNNVGYGIYGLAVGGKGWDQIFDDHPEVNSLPPGERESRIMQIVISEITQKPENFIKGLGYQFSVLFSFQPMNSLFSFTSSSNPGFNKLLIAILFILSGFGIISVVLYRSLPFYQLIAVFLGGFFSSLVLAPAYQTQYMRVYAASIPIIALLPALGLESILKRVKKLIPVSDGNNHIGDNQIETPFLVFSFCLVIVIFVGPILTKYSAGVKDLRPTGCEIGNQEAVIDFFPGTSVNIFENTPEKMTWTPNVSLLDYKRDIHSICCENEIQYFVELPPSTIYPAVNLLDGEGFYLIAKTGQLPDSRRIIRVCGKMEDVHRNPIGRDFLSSFKIIEYLN